MGQSVSPSSYPTWLRAQTRFPSTDPQKDLLSSDKSWVWPPHPMAETALESLRRGWKRSYPGRKPDGWVQTPSPPGWHLPREVCPLIPCLWLRLLFLLQDGFQPDVSHHAPGVDTQATTHYLADPGVSPTGKQPQAVTRMAGLPHQRPQWRHARKQISNRFLWQVCVVICRESFS